MLKHLTYLVV